MESQDLTDVRQEGALNVGKTLGLIPMFILILIIVLRISWVLYRSTLRQKTRSSQQRRVYVGSRTRRLSAQEPSIYVSPANLPPPPKYEAMAPPSYDEVMGVQYPSYQRQQPITQPLTHALAQSTSTADTNVTIVNETTSPATLPSVVTVTTDERRTSVTVRSS